MEGGGGVRGGLEEEEKDASEEPSGAQKGQLKRLQSAIGPGHTHEDLRGINGESNYIKSCQLA